MNHTKIGNKQCFQRAFEVLPPWYEWGQATPSIRYGKSIQEVKEGAEFEDIEETKVRRCPEHDLFAPLPDPCLDGVPHHQQGIIAHANGNDTSSYGFRDYYCASKEDPDLLSLVDKGLMSGPVYSEGALPNNLAYFYLTKQGRQAARSLLPRRRGKQRDA